MRVGPRLRAPSATTIAPSARASNARPTTPSSASASTYREWASRTLSVMGRWRAHTFWKVPAPSPSNGESRNVWMATSHWSMRPLLDWIGEPRAGIYRARPPASLHAPRSGRTCRRRNRAHRAPPARPPWRSPRHRRRRAAGGGLAAGAVQPEPRIEPQQQEPQKRCGHDARAHDKCDLLALVDGLGAGGVGGGEQIRAVRGHDRDHGGRDGCQQRAHESRRARDRDVRNESHDAGGDRAAREGEEQRRRQHRHGRGSEHARGGRFAATAREVEGEDGPHRGEQAERVPIGERVAQPLVGDRPRDRPDVGKHAGDQPAQAHTTTIAARQAAQHPLHRRRAARQRAEQEQREQIEDNAVEFEGGAPGSIGPRAGKTGPRCVERKRPGGQRERLADTPRTARPRARSAERATAREDQRHEGLGVRVEASCVEAEIDGERPGEQRGAPAVPEAAGRVHAGQYAAMDHRAHGADCSLFMRPVGCRRLAESKELARLGTVRSAEERGHGRPRRPLQVEACNGVHGQTLRGEIRRAVLGSARAARRFPGFA